MGDSAIYQIRVEGRLDGHWPAWFDGMTLTHEADDTTVLRGPQSDQAALHGLLARVRGLGMVLVSLRRIAPPDGPEP